MGMSCYEFLIHPFRVISTLCSFKHEYQERNLAIMKVFTVMTVSTLYACMGLAGIDHCPVQPILPWWVLLTGSALCVAAPTLSLYHRIWLADYLKNSTNEDLYRSVYDGLKKESGGKIKLALMAVLCLLASAWWLFGAVLIYSVYRRATSQLTRQGEPSYCDGAVYYITLQIHNLSWFVLFMAMLWFVSSVFYDERFRRSISELIRYEVIHPNQLTYEMHRHRSTISRRIRRSTIRAFRRSHRQQHVRKTVILSDQSSQKVEEPQMPVIELGS